jgi:hypothetical protein
MRTLIASAAAIVSGLFLLATFANQGSAVPVEAGRLPASLERLMENPVIQVHSRHYCKHKGMCTGCTRWCDHWKHSDYCKEHHEDLSCCKDWDEKCVCVPCLDHQVPQ